MYIVQVCCGNIRWNVNCVGVVDNVGQTDNGGNISAGFDSGLQA